MKLLNWPPKKLSLLLFGIALALGALTWGLTNDALRSLSVMLISNSYMYFLLQKSRAGGPTNMKIKALILDRSGALASAVPELKALKSIDPRISELALMQRVASLLHKNEDLLSRTVLAAARAKSLELLDVEQFRSVPDQGVVGVVSQRRTFVGSAKFLRSEGIQPGALESLATSLVREGHNVALIGAEGKAIGIVAVSEPQKLESREQVDRARSLGLEVILLSGDDMETARALAGPMGITQVFAGVTPAKKSEIVKQIQRDCGGQVEFIAGELKDNLEKFEKTQESVQPGKTQNMVFLLYNVIAPLAAGAFNLPPAASFAVSLVSAAAHFLSFRQRITS